MRKYSSFQCDGFERIESFKSRAIFLLGLCFDGGASFRKGAVKGPHAIRAGSYSLETYSPDLDRDLCDQDYLFDLGDILFEHGQSEESYLQGLKEFSFLTEDYHFKRDSIKLVTLGGDHSISYAPLKKYLEDFDDLMIIHLDAHADLRCEYQGLRYSHASVIRRVLDHFGDQHKLLQYGIRSGTRDEYHFMKQKGTLVTSMERLKDEIQTTMDSRPIYVTLDLDFFDPRDVPGTGNPETGGEDFMCLKEIVALLKNKNFVGADIVELAPDIDPTGRSAIFAAKVLREFVLAMLWPNKRKP